MNSEPMSRSKLPHPRRRIRLKGRIAVLHGQLSANAKPRVGIRVQLIALIRTLTPGGAHFADHPAGTVLTNKTGHYALRIPIHETTGFLAAVDDTTSGDAS